MSTIGQLMTRDVNSIPEETSIQEAAHHMVIHRIGSLLVERNQELCGIVTEADIVRAVAEHLDVARQSVKEIMSSPIVSVDHKLSPHYARDFMADRRIRHLGVTDNDTIVGIISVRDLLAYFKMVSKPVE